MGCWAGQHCHSALLYIGAREAYLLERWDLLTSRTRVNRRCRDLMGLAYTVKSMDVLASMWHTGFSFQPTQTPHGQ